mgnify:FL=1
MAHDQCRDVIKALNDSNNIVVLCGAGVSVSCGIPDFRSKNGLYNTLNAKGFGLDCAEDLFDLQFFSENPAPFYRFSKALFPGVVSPSLTHRFLGRLESNKKLLRCYTQNIDNLEESGGVSEDKIVYAHGSLKAARCLSCGSMYRAADIYSNVMAGTVPLCTAAKKISASKKRKLLSEGKNEDPDGSSNSGGNSDKKMPPIMRRSSRQSSINAFEVIQRNQGLGLGVLGGNCCSGVLKPTVTFFGESLEKSVSTSLNKDKKKVDCLIVIGTSLSVAPMSKIIDFFDADITRILINRNEIKTGSSKFSYTLLGNCDDVIRYLSDRLNWDDIVETAVEPGEERIKAPEQVAPGVLSFLGGEKVEDSSHDLKAKKTTTDDEQPLVRTVSVICDGCGDNITNVWTCTTCFDHDLCFKCHKSRQPEAKIEATCVFVYEEVEAEVVIKK